MIIKPYTDANLLLEPNATDFPALMFALDYNGCDFTNDTITCPISGNVITVASGLTDNGDRSWSGGGTIPGASISGTLPAPGTDNTVTIATFTSLVTGPNGSWQYGDGYSTDGWYVYNGSSTVAIDASNYQSIGALTPTASYPIANCATALKIAWTSGSGVTTKMFCDATYNETVVTGVATAGTLNAGISVLADQIVIPGGASCKMSGFYIFTFGAMPGNSEVYAAAGWMAANPGYVYPGWRYKT